MKEKIIVIACVILIFLIPIPFLKLEGSKVRFATNEELKERFSFQSSRTQSNQNDTDTDDFEDDSETIVKRESYAEYQFITIRTTEPNGDFKDIYIDVYNRGKDENWAYVYDSVTKVETDYDFTEETTKKIVSLTNKLYHKNKKLFQESYSLEEAYKDQPTGPKWNLLLHAAGLDYCQNGAGYEELPKGWEAYIDDLLALLDAENTDCYPYQNLASGYDNTLSASRKIESTEILCYDEKTDSTTCYSFYFDLASGNVEIQNTDSTTYRRYFLDSKQNGALRDLIKQYCIDHVVGSKEVDKDYDRPILWQVDLHSFYEHFLHLYSYDEYPEDWDSFIADINKLLEDVEYQEHYGYYRYV